MTDTCFNRRIDTDEKRLRKAKIETQTHYTRQRNARMLTIVLLTISNVFMTIAWYGHLNHKNTPLMIAIIVSWLIAFLEYCFQVPANRWGSSQFTPVQLKVIQEIITLVVFSVFAVKYLDQKLGWNHAVAFALIVAAVFFVRTDSGNQRESTISARVHGMPESSNQTKT